MATNEQQPLNAGLPQSAAELEEIAECERLIAWADDVKAGRHPTLPVPSHLRPQTTLDFRNTVKIDFEHNYYKDLGVRSEASKNSVDVAWKSIYHRFSPGSAEGSLRLRDPNPNGSRIAKEIWDRVCKAHDILTDPILKAKYDAGRNYTAEETVGEFTEARAARQLAASKSLEGSMEGMELDNGKQTQGQLDAGKGNLERMFQFKGAKFAGDTGAKQGVDQIHHATSMPDASTPNEKAQDDTYGKQRLIISTALAEKTVNVGTTTLGTARVKQAEVLDEESKKALWNKYNDLQRQREAMVTQMNALEKRRHVARNKSADEGELKRQVQACQERLRGLALQITPTAKALGFNWR